MAITIDVGDPNDLHPADKAPVAHRLALLARNRVYGEDVVSSGPLIESAERMENGEVRLAFRHTGSGLQALDATEPGGFEVAGSDGKFVAARARIDGDSVIVRSEETTPLHVRYAWSPNPVPASNLYNGEGLPASPFSIEIQHPSETE